MLELDFNDLPRSPLKITSPGRRWLEDHRDRSTNTGDALSNPLIAGIPNLQERISPKVSFASESESQSGTDDYGSSEGDVKGKSSGSTSGSGKRVGFRDQPEEEEEEEVKNQQLNTTILANETDSDESSDSYGDSDDYVPLSRSRTLRRPAHTQISSGSSDDVPLGQRVQNPEELRRQLRYLDRKAMPPKDKQKKMAEALSRAQAKVAEETLSKRSYDLDADDLIARLLLVQEGREAKKREAVNATSALARQNTSIGRSRSLAHRRPAATEAPPLPVQAHSNAHVHPQSHVMANLERSLSNQSASAKSPAPHRIQTTNLNPIVRSSQKSSPVSPAASGAGGLQLFNSSMGRSDSTEGSMKTAREFMIPSSSSNQHGGDDDDRQRSLAPEINTRNRSRSQAQQYIASPIEGSRALPLPVGSTSIHRSNSKRERAEPASGPISASSKVRPNLSIPLAEDQESRSMRPSSGTSNLIPLSHLVQHRVYLLNKQRVGTAEVSHSARVRDVVVSIIEKESMPIDNRKGEWVLYDVCPALGIERPLREYEVLSDIIALRSNSQDDYLCIRRTELSSYLSIKNVPNSSASLAGWVHIRDNQKKKWNKRWLELRDNCLYIARSEKGKEEVLLCSLSAFDLYLCDQERCKTPKAHAFAMRSQNSIEMFESPEADYVHYVCLSDAAASRHWITAIINSRTFVLKQEKSQLFRMASPKTAPSTLSSSQMATHTSNGRQSNELDRATRVARVPLGASSPSLNVPTPSNQTSSLTPAGPLLSFQQPTYVKGSLMEERFHQEAQLSTGLIPQSILLQQRQTANDLKRREEVQLAERKGRKEGKPLIEVCMRGATNRQ